MASSASKQRRRLIQESLLCLSLCHTAFAEVKINIIPLFNLHFSFQSDEKELRGIRYDAASPDEVTLVEAAKQLGYTFAKRRKNIIDLKVRTFKESRTEETKGKRRKGEKGGRIEKLGENVRHMREVEASYEVLHVNEFNSSRKRMSVMVKTPEGRRVLYCKGADSTMQHLLTHSSRYVNECFDHVDVRFCLYF